MTASSHLLANKRILLAAIGYIDGSRLLDTVSPLLRRHGAEILYGYYEESKSFSRISHDLMESIGFKKITLELCSTDKIDAIFTIDSYAKDFSSEIPVISLPHAFLNGCLPIECGLCGCDFYCIEQPSANLDILFQKYKYRLSSRNGTVTLMPSGSIKLDMLKQACDTTNHKDAIMYCTNPLTGASSFLQDGQQMIRMILNNFKDYNLIIRPYPGEATHPNFMTVVEPFIGHDRFEIDRSPSTLEHTPRAQVVISNHSTTGIIYSYATLLPHIDYSYVEHATGSAKMMPCGVTAHNLTQLMVALKICLEEKELFTDSIRDERDSRIYKVGQAENLLVNNLVHILNGSQNPDWITLEMNPVPNNFYFPTPKDEALHFSLQFKADDPALNIIKINSYFVSSTSTTWCSLYIASYWATRAAQRKEIILLLLNTKSPLLLDFPKNININNTTKWHDCFAAWGHPQDFSDEEHEFISHNSDVFIGFLVETLENQNSHDQNDYNNPPLLNKKIIGELTIKHLLFPANEFKACFLNYIETNLNS